MFLSPEVVVQAFNTSSWEIEVGESLSSRPAWSSERVLRQVSKTTERPCVEKTKDGRSLHVGIHLYFH